MIYFVIFVQMLNHSSDELLKFLSPLIKWFMVKWVLGPGRSKF